jgi:hypothetical protein
LLERLSKVIEREYLQAGSVNTQNAFDQSKADIKKHLGSVGLGARIYKKLHAASPRCFSKFMNMSLINRIHAHTTKMNAQKALVSGEQGEDVWGMPFKTEVHNGKTALRSAGDDSLFYTKDDQIFVPKTSI